MNSEAAPRDASTCREGSVTLVSAPAVRRLGRSARGWRTNPSGDAGASVRPAAAAGNGEEATELGMPPSQRVDRQPKKDAAMVNAWDARR